MAEATYKLTCRFGEALKSEIERYAAKHDMVFAEAVRELCERALTYDYDAGYAPQIGRLVENSVSASDRRTESLVTNAIDSIMSEMSEMERRLATRIDDAYEE